MKYTCETIIRLPRKRVIELFDNPDNLKEWMPGLVKFEHVSGVAGQPGAVSRLEFQLGKRKMIMTETVTVRNLPDEFSGTYIVNGAFNEVRNFFEETVEGYTRHRTENYFRFSGIMKIFAWMMAGTFRKTSQDYLERFKAFAEQQG
ncbi:MAG: SRPBCC family protein [Bacteroidia bacterium]